MRTRRSRKDSCEWTYLSSVIEKKTSSTISVLSITWVEALLTNQGSLLVTDTLVERGGGVREGG